MAIQQYILTGDQLGNYTLVCHYLAPVGSNAVGVAWQTAILNAKLTTTILTTGNGPGQISAADAALIASGAMVEVVTTFKEPLLTLETRTVDDIAKAAIAVDKARIIAVLNFFGFTQGIAS